MIYVEYDKGWLENGAYQFEEVEGNEVLNSL